MKKCSKFLTKQIVVIAAALLLSGLNSFSVMAQEEIMTNTDFEQKKAAGMDVYELIDDNGNIIGYFEPYSDINPAPSSQIIPRYASLVDVTVAAGDTVVGSNQYTLQAGDEMQLDISQNTEGKSYLRFKNRDTNSYIRFLNTQTTNGWHGTLHLTGIETATYSFGIENASSKEITYSGTYSL